MKYYVINPDNFTPNDEREEELFAHRFDSTKAMFAYIMYLILPPIEDYHFAIDVLLQAKERRPDVLDVRLAILGAYHWTIMLPIAPNPFLPLFAQYLEHASDNDRSLLLYLTALDMDMNHGIDEFKHPERYPHFNVQNCPERYRSLLEQSIALQPNTVYPYERLARVTPRSQRAALLERALANWLPEDARRDPTDPDPVTDYAEYINEFVTGIICPERCLREIKDQLFLLTQMPKIIYED